MRPVYHVYFPVEGSPHPRKQIGRSAKGEQFVKKQDVCYLGPTGNYLEEEEGRLC